MKLCSPGFWDTSAEGGVAEAGGWMVEGEVVRGGGAAVTHTASGGRRLGYRGS